MSGSIRGGGLLIIFKLYISLPEVLVTDRAEALLRTHLCIKAAMS